MGPNFVEKDEISLSTDENGQVKTEGKNLKLWLQFANPKNGQLLVKVGVSAVSEEGALKNLEAELPSWDFDAVVADAQKHWNAELSRIDVSGGTPEQLTTFYSSLYHAMVAPNVFSNVDGQYRGMDNQIHQADGFTPYTVFSL